ncbi:hypothetical protein RND81_06G063800 [Saponaria officinalis]
MAAFNDALYATGLDDIPTHGCQFTWTNKQDDGDRKWMRLDRAVAYDPWHVYFPSSYADALPAGVFDHSPIVVSVCASGPARPVLFRFLNRWTQDPQFAPLVVETWTEEVRGCPMYKLVSHLKSMKAKLKVLHRSTYSGISNRVADLRSRLFDCQLLLQSDPLNQNLLNAEMKLCHDFCKFKNIELSIAYQRAKAQDIKIGDASTSYFFAKVAARRKISTISKITNLMGNECLTFDSISAAFVSYYLQLLGTSVPVKPIEALIIQTGLCLTNEDYGPLITRVSDAKIKNALFVIDINKSPGPDGFTSGFFKAAWDTIKREEIFVKS